MSREGRTGRRVIAGAAAAAAALVALVAPGADGSSKPHARLSVSDPTPTVGQEVVFDSSRSRGDIAYHLWDLDGDREYETSTRMRARVSHVFKRPGKVRVTVAVFDDDGGHSVRRTTVRVGTRQAPRSVPAAKHSGHADVRAATKAKKKAADAVSRVAKAQSSSSDESPTVQKAASSESVTIRDFEFEPKSITVSVGTTVTWTNEGPAAHTATADEGTFDTGNLVKGTSRSYKFEEAGTFKYHCTPHPDSMKATVTVSDSGGSSAPDDSSSNDSGSGGDSDKDSSLPHTGLRIASFVLAGLLLFGGGVALRRRLSRS